jgi:uncharacterized protein YdeI (YjbR/CyaY-like superfamily)
MSTRDPRVDAYIRKAAPFAQPILKHLREVVHAACPQVTETLKWRMPSFEHHGILCGMAAFKQHCVFGFWKHELVLDGEDPKWREAMGSFGCIKSLKDLPSKAALARYVKKAALLNEQGVKAPRTKTKRKPLARTPPALATALARNAKARAAWDGFPPSHKREYSEWVAEAKRDETRERRVKQAIAWMAQGKPRNWKYMVRSDALRGPGRARRPGSSLGPRAAGSR